MEQEERELPTGRSGDREDVSLSEFIDLVLVACDQSDDQNEISALVDDYMLGGLSGRCLVPARDLARGSEGLLEYAA